MKTFDSRVYIAIITVKISLSALITSFFLKKGKKYNDNDGKPYPYWRVVINEQYTKEMARTHLYFLIFFFSCFNSKNLNYLKLLLKVATWEAFNKHHAINGLF